MTGYSDSPPRVTFRPIKVDRYARDYLWRHGRRWLLMSATIISAEQMALDLGLERGEWKVVVVPSTFPPHRRPVVYRGVADMAQRNQGVAVPDMGLAVNRIISDFPDDRILIHTVSYRLADALMNRVKGEAQGRLVTYHTAKERRAALELFKEQERSVAIVPSWDRGVDLPDDLCRVIVVAKIPFPYLGDQQISKRLYSPGGKGWYSMQTARTLVQMTGRGMRHEDDWCITFVLDEQFKTNVWSRSKRMLPSWWRDSIRWDGKPPREWEEIAGNNRNQESDRKEQDG
jgi:Rad3-related DNA helicase